MSFYINGRLSDVRAFENAVARQAPAKRSVTITGMEYPSASGSPAMLLCNFSRQVKPQNRDAVLDAIADAFPDLDIAA